jgi:hypothetical protein
MLISQISAVDLVIFSLATYRITRLITTDHVFNRIRDKFWNRFPPETTKLGYLITCEWCTSVWVGLVFAVWYTINTDIARLCAFAFALSAATGLLTAYENRD